MISYEGTRPDPLPSLHYNKFEFTPNDIEDLALRDESGELTEDPLLFFTSIIDDLITTLCESDDIRVCRAYTNHLMTDQQLLPFIKKQKPASIAKSLDNLNVQFHANTK